MVASLVVPHARPTTLANPANTYEDDFETADTSKWASVTGSPPVAGTYKKNGSNGLLISPANSAKSVGTSTGKWTQTGLPFFSAALWVQFKAFSSGKTQSVLTIANTGNADNLDIFLSSSNQAWVFDLKAADQIVTSVIPSLDTWYRLRAKGDYSTSTWTADIMVDSTYLGRCTSTGETARSTRSVIIGEPTNTDRTSSFWADDFRIVCAASDPGWLV